MSGDHQPATPEPNEHPDNSGVHYGSGSLTLLVVASMIGSGVFTTSGYTLGAVGSPFRVVLCWVIAGAIAICGAIAYGRLARLMPQSGGEYLYLARNVHPAAGFLAGWVSLVAGFSGAIAYAAVAFEQYALPDDIRPEWLPPDLAAVAIIVICACAHGLRMTVGKVSQDFLVIIKLCVLTGFLVFIAFRIPHHAWHVAIHDDAPAVGIPLLNAIAQSLVWISLSYAGFNAAIYVASESTEASRAVPTALLKGTVLVTALYICLNAAFVMAVPANQLAWKEPVAAIAAEAIGGRKLGIFVRVAVCFGLLTSVSGMVMSGPRVYSKMADDRVFPSGFRAAQGGISRSIALQAAISIGLIVIQRILVASGVLQSSLFGLLIFLSTTLSVSSACCVLTLFLPKVRRQLAHREVIKDLATAVYVLFTLTSVVVLMVTHKDAQTGESHAMHHLTGIGLTLVSGIIAWCIFGTGNHSRREDRQHKLS